MPTLSPLLASYPPPFKGMDSRTVREAGAPSLLLNVDLSDRGSLKQRPGSRVFANASNFLGGAIGNPLQPRGMFAYTYEDNLFLFLIVYDPVNKNSSLLIYKEDGSLRSIYGLSYTLLNQPEFPLEPNPIETKKNHYVFSSAGRFVYFCNGAGNFYRLEINDQIADGASFTSPNFQNFTIIANNFEEGSLPLVRSYILSGLSPSSLDYFFDQLIVTGFKKERTCKLSLTVKNKDEKESFAPPEQLLDIQRDLITVDPSSVMVSEPLLWDSYPINDPGGFYWMINENVVASVGLGSEILVFTENYLYKIVGAGNPNPRKFKFAQVSLASSRSYCYFKDMLFFVALDGCYTVSPQSIQKVSFEMDDLWFSRKKPEVTRYSESKLKNTPFPYFVDIQNLHTSHCVTDRSRQQIMVSMKSMGASSNDMVWVYNFSDMLEGVGKGKWSIWTSDDRSPYTSPSLTPGVAFPSSKAVSPYIVSNDASYNVYNWGASAQTIFKGKQRVFFVTTPDIPFTPYRNQNQCLIYEFGTDSQDLATVKTFSANGTPSGVDTPVHFPFLISMGRVARVDHDGRIICTDVAVRRKQLSKNNEDDSDAAVLTAIVRSEGEGLKYFDANETDVEFSDTIFNSQIGISENTTSTLNTMKLGQKPSGTSSPLISSEYFDSYARVNTPDEEGRSVYVDLYSKATSQPLRIDISEVRVYGDAKGGSQREQS